jgi:hypothetical protein
MLKLTASCPLLSWTRKELERSASELGR